MKVTEKHWRKINDYHYELWQNQQRAIELKLNPNASGNKAEIFTNITYYTLQRTGFWKNTIVIYDAHNNEVLKSNAGKWHSNKFAINFTGKALQGEIRNNPLAELVLLFEGKEMLCYGLSAEGSKAAVKISEQQRTRLLLDAFCMFVFLPVIQENTTANEYQYNGQQDHIEGALFIG